MQQVWVLVALIGATMGIVLLVRLRHLIERVEVNNRLLEDVRRMLIERGPPM